MPPIHDDICATAADMLFLSRLTVLLCVLVFLKIISQIIIFKRTQGIYDRVNTLLTMTERHGESTDKRAAEIESNTQTVATVVAPLLKAAPLLQATSEEVKREVKEMSEKVVSAIKQEVRPSESGSMPIPLLPPRHPDN